MRRSNENKFVKERKKLGKFRYFNDRILIYIKAEFIHNYFF